MCADAQCCTSKLTPGRLSEEDDPASEATPSCTDGRSPRARGFRILWSAVRPRQLQRLVGLLPRPGEDAARLPCVASP